MSWLEAWRHNRAQWRALEAEYCQNEGITPYQLRLHEVGALLVMAGLALASVLLAAAVGGN